MLCEMRRAVEMPLLPGKGPRQRRVVPLADESASSTLAKTKRTGHSTQSHLLPGASVVVCVLVYICTGIYCALSAPKATSKFGDHIVPDTARCARVTATQTTPLSTLRSECLARCCDCFATGSTGRPGKQHFRSHTLECDCRKYRSQLQRRNLHRRRADLATRPAVCAETDGSAVHVRKLEQRVFEWVSFAEHGARRRSVFVA